MLLFLGLICGVKSAYGVYGDILFARANAVKVTEGDKKQRVPPAVFPHWLHRVRFQCLVCHPSIFEMKKGANEVSMKNIKAGEFCGRCHNGQIAFSPELDNCYKCHKDPQIVEKIELVSDGSPDDVGAGREIYEKWCVHCHGKTGEGDGIAAPFFIPMPRNFIEGQFKIRTTPSGELPIDEDIVKSIMKGMPGSSMPAWDGLLTTREVKQTITYIKTLMEDWVFEGEPPEPIKISEPLPATDESISKGRELYKKLKCWECHGQEGKGDGPSAATLKDDWGFPIVATDLTKNWTFRGGNSVSDIYRTITTGLNGTPMPSFADTIIDEERWNLTNFVKSLSKDAKPSLRTFWELK